MEPGQPDTKRPRLSTGGSPWLNHGASLPHPTAAHHPPVSGPHHHHPPPPPPPPPPYQPPPPTFSRPSDPSLPPANHSHDDRRHYDHEPYPPIHDPHRQHPLSPAHPPYPPYPPRDAVVKRDPVEEASLPHLRRPNSTGNVVDGLPAAPHGPGPQHPPHQHPDDVRRHMSFDNGSSMPHSPALYRPPQNYHPPPTPTPQHPQYDSPHVYGPPAPIYSPLDVQHHASAKRKAQRASQACDSCRQLKAKCDETKPCKNCREKNVECKYRDPPAKQPDKVSADILEAILSLKDEFTRGFATVRRIDDRLTSVENTLKQSGTGTSLKLEPSEERELPNPQDSPVSLTKADEQLSSPGTTTADTTVHMQLKEAQETLRDVDDELEERPGPAVLPSKPAMPPGHTTLAGLLLKWPSIERMVRHHLDAERVYFVDEFPIRQEQQRGMLRVFGRGEGFDKENRIADKLTPPDPAYTDTEDQVSDISSPSPKPYAWGQVASLTPPPGVEYKGGTLNPDGNPDWDHGKVWNYVTSFKDNILNMHPIIVHKELDAMVTMFLASVGKPPSSQPAKTRSRATFVDSIATTPILHEAGMKRKRSPAAEDPTPSVPHFRLGRPFRSIQHAFVLLVLALGKICLHRDKVPDVVREAEPQMHNSPSVRNGVLSSPTQGSPPGVFSQSHSAFPSPKENDRYSMSRRPSLRGHNYMPKASPALKRNLDVIPGLEYFALATDIIGTHFGGYNLKHVYVHILAGLYHGQLGRVLESWSYISKASQTLQVILRPSLGRLSSDGNLYVGESRRDNQLAFAFWTCLQLESDILAELPLPQSGILQYEDRMPYPNSKFAIGQGFPENVIQGYLAQLYLRKQLNRVHNLLYDPEKSNRTRDDPAIHEEIEQIQGSLKDKRHMWVPHFYTWNDDDLPANDILSARLRAKYWGSQVIVYRPFLRSILEREPLPTSTFRDQAPPPHTWASLGLEVGSPNIPSSIDPRTLNYARLAIHALIESTRAFQGLDPNQRIIVTNVFGTAHAQWGNLLTLAACYRDSVLSRFIEADLLATLFSRTISFFRMIAYPTSALMVDMNILIGVNRDFGFPQHDTDIRTNSSFSSLTSGGPLPPMQSAGDNYNMHSAPPSSILRPHHLPPIPSHSML